jgi:protein subunit release factor B
MNEVEGAPEEEVVREGDLEISFFKSTGPGGQHKNKRETAVRIRHVPTGVTVVAAEERSQARNREVALERLAERLERLRRKPKRRYATKPTRASKERRLKAKKLRGEKKAGRRTSGE